MAERRRAVTMKDIAEQVGVSKMAVSAVLSGTSTRAGVSAATRERILGVARQLRYRPNAIARALSSKRTNIIGFYSGYHYIDPRNAFIAAIVGGLQEGCIEYRKDLLLHTVQRGSSISDIYSALMDGRIDGLVMTAPTEDPLVELLTDASLPVIVVSDAVPGLPSVVVDDAAGARMTFEHLMQQGHSRVVYFNLDRHLVSAERRRTAYFQVAAEVGLELSEWRAPDVPGQNAEEFLEAWEAQPAGKRSAAVVCWNDAAAYNLISACDRRGIRVPRDLAIAGFDGDPNPLASRFRLTTVAARWAITARTALDQLIAYMETGQPFANETVLPVEFIAGDSA